MEIADIRQDLGDWVDAKEPDTDDMKLIRKHSKKNVVNIYVVGKLINKSNTHGVNVDLDCVVDTRPPLSKSLAD